LGDAFAAVPAANWAGTSTAGCERGVVQPVSITTIDAASARRDDETGRLIGPLAGLVPGGEGQRGCGWR